MTPKVEVTSNLRSCLYLALFTAGALFVHGYHPGIEDAECFPTSPRQSTGLNNSRQNAVGTISRKRIPATQENVRHFLGACF